MIKKIGVKIALIAVMAVFVAGMIAGTYARYVREASAQGTVKASEFKLNEDEIKAFDLSVELAPTEMKEFVIPVSTKTGVHTMQTVELVGANSVIKPLKYSLSIDGRPIDLKNNRLILKGTEETVNYKIVVEWPETDNDTAFEGQTEKISFIVKNEQIIWQSMNFKVNMQNRGEIMERFQYLAAHYQGASSYITWYTPEPDVKKSFKVASMKLDGDNFSIIGVDGQQIIYNFNFNEGYYWVRDEKGRVISNKCDLLPMRIDAYWKVFRINHDVDGYGHTGYTDIGYGK